MRIVVGVHDERVHIMSERLILKSGRDVREEGVTDIGDEQAEERASATARLRAA